MKTRKILVALLALIIALTVIPLVSLAQGIGNVANESRKVNKLDAVWIRLNRTERTAINNGLSRDKVISAVYEAALNTQLIDKDSFSDFSKDGFFFTVDGMSCAYNYRLNNELKTDGVQPIPESEAYVVYPGKGNQAKVERTRSANLPTSNNVLLVAPYYGHDASFTNQYKNEAQSIADTLGGNYTLIQSTQATGPRIAQNYTDKGVVIYDSHGIQTGTSSYLCLTTSVGITTDDYNNGWAVRSNNVAFIDGRYIQNHVDGDLSNCFVWMAICEGMKAGGRGTTGTALLEAGAAGVYGYSQSVSFSGDYKYEATFWTEMKAGKTVAEAIKTMKDRHGLRDTRISPYAWPIVMSPIDNFPANPDSAQTVNCDWQLVNNNEEPVALTNYGFDKENIELNAGESTVVTFNKVPQNANNYELVWTSSNTAVATVKGTNNNATVTGVGAGNATVTCRIIIDNATAATFSIPVTVNVQIDNSLNNALNVAGGNIDFISTGKYPFKAVSENGVTIAKSSNTGISNSSSKVSCVVNMEAKQTISFECLYSSEKDHDWFDVSVNGVRKLHLSGTDKSWTRYTYTAPSAGSYTFEWSYTKDGSIRSGEDCVKLANIKLSSGAAAPAPTANKYVEVTAPTSGEQYVIVHNGKAVGNSIKSGKSHYINSYDVVVNNDSTITIPDSVDARSIRWTVFGNATAGWSFRNVSNNKYLGLDSTEYLSLTTNALSWKWQSGDLNNGIDSTGYYYLSISADKAYFTTSKASKGNIKLYKYVTDAEPASVRIDNGAN